MLGSFYITQVRGVPIRLHFTALLLLPWFNRIVQGLGLPQSWVMPVTLTFILFLLVSVALHELGHTLVAQRYHIHVQDIVLTPIGGVARMVGSLENPNHEIRVALAGPYVSLALSGAGWLLSLLFYNLDWMVPGAFSRIFAYLNLMLFAFNLLPSFPMDGGRVLRGWLAQRKGMMEATRIASALGRMIAIGFVVIGLSTDRINLAIIGGFIFMAAGSEYRMMKLKTWQEQTFGIGAAGLQPPQVEVSPPPYAASSTPAIKGFPADLVATARDLVEEILGKSPA